MMKQIILLTIIACIYLDGFGQKKLLKQIDERKIIQLETDSLTVEASVKHFDIKTKDKRLYYWYWKNEIQKNYGNYHGVLLHGEYVKYDLRKNLIEKAKFKKGLAKGKFYTWNKDGTYLKIEKWKKGVRKGKYKWFDELGVLVEKGKMKNNKRNGSSKVYVEGKLIEKQKFRKGVFVAEKQQKEKGEKTEKKNKKENGTKKESSKVKKPKEEK